MVAALNVGNIQIRFPTSGPVQRGEEAGAFGFGSTVVVIVEKGGPSIVALAPETVVRMGQGATA
jgi:phosphatidylserine decarboxylase